MSTVPAEVHGPSDAELIESVRKGTVSAYGSLYERHVGAAYNLARQMTRNQAEADDLVSESFAKVLDTLRAGRGPDSAFRAYLLTALRHTAYDKTRRDRKVELSDDVTTVAGADTAVPFSDTAVAGLERSLAARAFARLPERWQAVLWHTEVEGQSPAEVAPILGLTPNGVSALAYRAREGLRQAYLQVHLAEADSERCRATAERLGAWTRSGLSKRETAQVEAHLDECAKCRALAAELADINGSLRGLVAPLVLGVGAAGYLAVTAKAATAAGVTAAASGTAAAGAGGAAASLPRQLIGAGVATAAVAIALVIALTAGSPDQTVPVAQQPVPAPSSTTTPKPVIPPPPPPPPQSKPNEPPAQTPPAQTPPAQTPPVQTPPVQTPPQETPAPPSLSVPSPPGITLVPGAGPADLPFTITNNGGSPSEPVSATLNLPPGVSAVGASRLIGEPLLTLNGPSSSVTCPAGTGTVTCSSGHGLQPGESVTLLFRIVATETSTGGTITGTVNAGSAISVSVAVKVEVQPPAKKDGVSIYAFPDWASIPVPGLGHAPAVQAIAKNTGESTKQVTVTVDEPATLLSAWPDATCTSTGATTSCVTDRALQPGERFYLRVRLRDWWSDDRDRSELPEWSSRKVHLSATLGTASATAQIRLPWWSWPLPPDRPKPTDKPTTSKPPTDSKPSTPSSPKPPTTDKPGGTTSTPGTSSTQPPVSTSTPPTSSRTPTTPAPPKDPCAGMGSVERLLAELLGQCTPRPGPGPR